MTGPLRTSSPLPVLASAVVSWLVMMATGLMLGVLVESRLGHLDTGNAGEYVVSFLVAMPVPFVLAIALVFAPVAMGLRVISSGAASPLAFGSACVLVAPFAGLLLLMLGTALWGLPTNAGGYIKFIAPLLAIASGGMAFGLAFGRVVRTGLSSREAPAVQGS